MAALLQEPPTLAVFDALTCLRRGPSHECHADFLRQCQLAWPETRVIMMSAAPEKENELAAARGAFGWLQKPFDADRLIALVCGAARLSGTFAPPSSGSEPTING